MGLTEMAPGRSESRHGGLHRIDLATRNLRRASRRGQRFCIDKRYLRQRDVCFGIVGITGSTRWSGENGFSSSAVLRK